MRVVLLRTHTNNSTHQLVCVQCSAVNVSSMWEKKDSPYTGLQSTHTRMHEGWRWDGSRQEEGGKAGRLAGTMLSCYPVLGIVQSVLQFNPWQKCSFKIHLNFSGKQLFWYPNCIDTCIFLCRDYVIILFKAMFSKHLYTKTNSTHQFVCILCSKINVRVTSMWTE